MRNRSPKLLAMLAISLLSLTNAEARDPTAPFELKQSEIRYVYDGDTIYISCRPEYKCTKGKLGVRARALDTPEIEGECKEEVALARLAKQHLVELKNNATKIVVYPDKGRLYDRYDRLLAYVEFDSEDWRESMIEARLGRNWSGTRGGWCHWE